MGRVLCKLKHVTHCAVLFPVLRGWKGNVQRTECVDLSKWTCGGGMGFSWSKQDLLNNEEAEAVAVGRM